MAIEATAFARAGLIGNPSDGYYGKTISFVIRDFCAKVTLYESPELEIVPALQDRFRYPNMRELVNDVRSNGYYGGVRLLKASIKRFVEYCDAQGIVLPERNCSLRYRTTIPRRLGMAGSSAIVTATFRCLMQYYDVEIPKNILPGVILSVETEELNIGAGLQDRVIQVFEGCVFMDFDKGLMDQQGHGDYVPLDPALLPPLFVAYREDLGEGSEVFHNNIRERWNRGDVEVVEAMKRFAGFAQETRDLLAAGRGSEIGPLMDANFNLRRTLFQLDPKNVDMVERARSVGAHAKFSGSGGAIVGTYGDNAMYAKLEETFREGGIAVFKPRITA